VCLVNINDPQESGWNKLERFASQGGGVAIFMGDRVSQAAYLKLAATNVFPGKLRGTHDFDPPAFLDLQNVSHPILRKFAEWGGGVLSSVEIKKCWSVDTEPVAGAIATYTDRRRLPALVERSVGKGRVLALTTAIDRRDWNDLPVDWGFMALTYEMMRYLSRSSQTVFNYTAGDSVVLPLEGAQRMPTYRLRKPGLQQLRNDVPPGSTNLIVESVDQLGNYRVYGVESEPPFERGFSVNSSASESNLERLSKDDLDSHLGAERYSIARDIQNLQRNVKAGRLGREAFPIVVCLLFLIFVGEHLIANRFYDGDQSASQPPS
jgi:hypothetical protein